MTTHMKTVTRTFRLDANWDQALVDEAEKAGITVSSLLAHIIRDYVVDQRFLQDHSYIILSNPVLTTLLEVCTMDAVADLAHSISAMHVEDALLRRGKPVTRDTLLWAIDEIYSRYCNWCAYRFYAMPDRDMVHLSHDRTARWSVFLREFFVSALNALAQIDVDTEIRDNAVTLYLPKTHSHIDASYS